MIDLQRLPRYSAPRISIFNHKGGVGKTTLTVNIAWSLASMGKRILLVDSDPQCNLTSYLVDDQTVDGLLDKSDSNDGRTVWSAVKPIVEAEGDVKIIKPYERTNNIYLLPGDIRLAEFEQELNTLWGDCLQRKTKGLRGTTALSHLVNHLAKQYKIDFVFYDSGPNIGALNRIILLDCDYFAIPAACDLFSLRALKTLGRTLACWIKDWQTILKLAPDNICLPAGEPKLLGYIPQRFRVWGGEPTTEFARFLPKLERQIFSDIVSVLKEINPKLASHSISHLRIGEIKDFASLATASQVQGVSMSDVNNANTNLRESARKAFEKISLKIIERTSKMLM